MSFFDFFKSKKEPVEQWKFLKTDSFQTTITGRGDTKYNFYIHYYESNFGNRKAEYTTDLVNTQTSTEFFVKQDPIYHTKVYRWLNGRADPDIPAYSNVEQDDLSNMLKGKVS